MSESRESVEWEGYEPFDPGVRGPLREQSRRDAWAAYDRLMAARSTRREQLGNLLTRNSVALDDTDAGIGRVNDWFRANVEPDIVDPRRLGPLWYAVVNDVALFLGDVLVTRNVHLAWEFYTRGRADVSYQCHVVSGFRRVANPKYHVDVDGLVASYAHRVVAGADVRDDQFVAWLDAAAEKA